jgi:multiple sugar transport system permease protein
MAAAVVTHHRTRKSLLEQFVGGPWPFILPGLLLYCLFSIYPLIYQFYIAMTDMQIATIYQANFIGLGNFQFIANDPIFREVFVFTLAFVIFTVPTQFILGFGLALLLDQQLPGRLFFRLAIIVPMAISSIVVGLMWRLILFEGQAGVVNAWLGQLGINQIRWFSGVTEARISVFIVNIWQSVGFTMVFMLGGLQTISPEILEAATVDGANTWQKIVRIKLPMLRQIAGLALIFIFLGAFQIFEKILVLTNGGPGRATSTIGFRMYQTAFTEGSIGLLGRGAAIGVVMFLFIMVFAVIYLWVVMLDKENE